MNITTDLRDTPTPAFVAGLRERFPTEPEVDRMLTRKMQRRDGSSHAPVTLELLGHSTRMLLAKRIEGPFLVRDERWLAGGASKLQMRFTLEWEHPGRGHTVSDLVVRMEPSESLNVSSRLREFELLRAMRACVPVPEVYWVDADGECFPEPALIYAFAEGVAKPSTGGGAGVTGIGTNFGPRLRALLAPQFVDLLARIHTFDLDSAELPSFARPSDGSTEAARLEINRTCRVWEEDRPEAFPLMDVAANWLRRNVPEIDRACVVHGEYRAGNFLFDEASGRISAVLDWERASIGDRHRDLAWTTARVIGHLAEDGKTFLVSGLLPLETFYRNYEAASGLTIDRKRLHFYEVLNRFQQVQTVLGTAYRIVRLGKSHQGIVVARLQCAAYQLAEELREALERGA